MTSRELARGRASRCRRSLTRRSSLLAPRRAVAGRGRAALLAPRPRRSRSPARRRSPRRTPPSSGDWLVARRRRRRCSSRVIGGRRARAACSSRPRYLRTLGRARSSRPSAVARTYYAVLFAFWAVLLAVPLAGNLGAAWLLVEATTAASALLVGVQRQAARARGRLEVPRPHLARARRRAARDRRCSPPATRAAGSARSPGARSPTYARRHGQSRARRLPAPARRPRREDRLGARPQLAPRRALRGAAAGLRAALGRAAAGGAARRVARPSTRSAPVVGARHRPRACCSASGSLSLAVAVPFLWRPLPWKRLLAYSSLEHMGVLALGIGFATPLALAGVVVHVAGHAVAKALGFYAATPLLGARAARRGPRRRAASPAPSRALGDGDGHRARRARRPAALAALRQRGADRRRRLPGRARPWAAAIAAVLLALGFLGLAHALHRDAPPGTAPTRPRPRRQPGCARVDAARPRSAVVPRWR